MNILSRYILFLLIVISTCYQSSAQVRVFRQPPPRRFERFENGNAQHRIETVKTNYLKNRLNLAPQQADKFFPLYHEYQQELFNVRKLKRENNLNGATDGTEQINKELSYENEIVQIKTKFNDAFLKVLSPEQVSELYKAEREFNDELIRQLAERKGSNPTGSNPPPVPQNIP